MVRIVMLRVTLMRITMMQSIIRFVKSKRGFVDDDMCKYLRGMLNSIHANADEPEVFQANLQCVKSLTQSLKPTFTPI